MIALVVPSIPYLPGAGARIGFRGSWRASRHSEGTAVLDG